MSAFIGTHRCRVDAKGRFNVPASFRRYLGTEGGETFVISRGTEQCLILFAPDGWKAFQEKLAALPAGADKKKTIRFYSANSATVVLDRQGRVGIPKDYLGDYGIEGEALLVGALDYIEVWMPEDFDRHLKDAEEVVRKMDTLL
jgi:MraZ protein